MLLLSIISKCTGIYTRYLHLEIFITKKDRYDLRTKDVSYNSRLLQQFLVLNLMIALSAKRIFNGYGNIL